MDIVSSALELTPRVQNGLDSIERGRFQEKELWNVPLSVLDDETRKQTLVKRKALAISKVLSAMPIRIETYELIVGFSVHNSVANITPFPEYATQEEREEAAGKYTGTFSVFGHFCPSYPKYLRLGVGGLRRQGEEKLSEIRRNGGDAEKRLESIDREALIKNESPFALVSWPAGTGERAVPNIILDDEVIQMTALKKAETNF